MSRVHLPRHNQSPAIIGYQTSVVATRTSIAGTQSALTAAETALSNAEGALTLAEAGVRRHKQSLSLRRKLIGAQAQVECCKVASNETVLVAPISGTITVQNAHLGQTVTPGAPLVSMIGAGAFEAKAPVSESDIGKVKVGDMATATFDEYPGESFPATVSAVDPAATVTNGVASYFVTASFTTNDPRIRSGLTAHLSIITASVPKTTRYSRKRRH